MKKRILTMGLAVSALYLAALSGGCAHARPRAEPQVKRSRVMPREILNEFECSERSPEDEQQENEDRLARLEALQLELSADHIRMTRHGSRTDRYMFAARGEPCATASDRAACEEELAELEARGFARPQVFAITILGDELKLYEGTEVIELLGAIDNPSKAWLVMMAHENAAWYFCRYAEWDGYREIADGYEVAWGWTERICPVTRLQAIGHVDRAGRYARLRTNVVEELEGACIPDESVLHPRREVPAP